MEWGSIEMGVAQKVFGIAQLGWSVALFGWNVDQMGWSVAQLGWTVAHQGWIELNRYGVQLNWDGVYISWHGDMYTLLKYKIQDLEKAKTDLKIAKMIIDSFYEHSGYEKLLNNSSLIEMLNYYNETILIVKQLHTLFTPMDDNSALILANID